MTSTLIIYKHCKIREEKLFIVDDISSYLNTLDKETITGFQYQRQGMTLRVKLNKTQNTLNFIGSNDFNYASIQNDSQKVCYYFIKGKKQLADSTIELELAMDTINTFRPTTDFEISAKTKINREHKDRVIIAGKSIKVRIIFHDPLFIGSIVAGDTITFSSDHDSDIFSGKVLEIDTDRATIEISNPTSEEDYMSYISINFNPYEIAKDGANYIRFDYHFENDIVFTTSLN